MTSATGCSSKDTQKPPERVQASKSGVAEEDEK